MTQKEKEEEEEKKQLRNDGVVEDVSRLFNFTYTDVPEEENRVNGKKVLKYKQKIVENGRSPREQRRVNE